MDSKNICIIVLSYNVEKFILEVLKDLEIFKTKVFVIDDKSKDNSENVIKKFIEGSENFELIINEKNIGAGASLKKAMQYAQNKNFSYFIKIDGDGQFLVNDVKKIFDLIKSENYDFIKSNRFWSSGIVGKIPLHRLVGNLLATLMMHIGTGTNILYDPLNGLFAGNISILNYLDSKIYPKRYGYPFYFASVSVNNYLSVYQINNTIKYKSSKDKLQFSAFLDIICILFNLLFFYALIKTFSYYFVSFDDGNQGQWFIISLFFLFSSIYCFIKSFKIESELKNINISIDV
jgi:glycosyltransferase involved in cell wall biosynthesis